MFNFQWPYFIFLLPLPFLVRYLWPSRTERAASEIPGIRFPHLARLGSAFLRTGKRGGSGSRVRSWLLFLVWSLLTVAMMRPQIVNDSSEAKSEGHDLMLAVDLSASMKSLDFSKGGERQSRLDVAKEVVRDFVRKRAGDRIGLVLFGEHAYLQAPLTLDTQAVSKMLDNSLSGMAGDATAIGDAIGLAVKNLRHRPTASRAIILLTDGEDNSSTIPPLEAAKLAQTYGIRIYTIVIGKEGVVPMPDGNGGLAMVESHVDTTLTRKIAELTGGEFYRSTDRKSLESIYDRIDALEKTESDPIHFVVRRPLQSYPIAMALTLLAIWGFATEVRKESYAF